MDEIALKLPDLILPKDFIASRNAGLFAVVSAIREDDRVLCFLRYAYIDGRWRKLDTETANVWLADRMPSYLYHSRLLDAHLHAVPDDEVVEHYSPRHGLQRLLSGQAADAPVSDLQCLFRWLAERGVDLTQVGITGSLLVGMQHAASDIDLVCYDRDVFHQMRGVVQGLMAENHCQALSNSDWLATYRRRATDFSLDDYIWHEQRKYNKGMINGRKFDLSLVVVPERGYSAHSRKLGPVQLTAVVTDDRYAFDYPARLDIRHPRFERVLCFTATYAGQAFNGETIAVSGHAEIDGDGRQVVIVGSNREAIGEYIRVIR